MATTNQNVLEGVECPSCGFADQFEVDGEGVFTLTDDGAVFAREFEYSTQAMMTCLECGYRAQAWKFEKGEGDED